MNTRQHLDLLTESLVTLRHARVFVTSREKMHPTGVELYDQLVTDIEFALKSPGPEMPSSDEGEHRGVRPMTAETEVKS